jgi:hypothetical protein
LSLTDSQISAGVIERTPFSPTPAYGRSRHVGNILTSTEHERQRLYEVR